MSLASDLEENEAHQIKYLDKNSQRIPRNFEAQLEAHPKLGVKHFINNKEKPPTRPKQGHYFQGKKRKSKY